MNFPCPIKVPCDTDDPFANLSAETPDIDVFIGMYFPPIQPPLGQSWVGTGCARTCTSTISQEDADLCAARQSVECQNVPPPVPNPPPGFIICPFAPQPPPPPS